MTVRDSRQQELAFSNETSSGCHGRADGDHTAIRVTGQVTVGRGPDNDLVINDKHVSSNHARLLRSGGGMFEVFDLQSTCGTFVNGVRVVATDLVDGDVIRLGRVALRYVRIR